MMIILDQFFGGKGSLRASSNEKKAADYFLFIYSLKEAGLRERESVFFFNEWKEYEGKFIFK
jgi:hypothetical protein